MGDREAFLAKIRGEPKEDSHRLVFADWLDEYGGEPGWAEFIRMQCGVTPYCKDRYPVLARNFFRGHLRPICGDGSVSYSKGHPGYAAKYRMVGGDSFRFWARRGFVDEALMTAADWIRYADGLAAAYPLTLVRLVDMSGWDARVAQFNGHAPGGVFYCSRWRGISFMMA